MEYATLTWVDWFNNRRLLAPIENIPPMEKKRILSAGELRLPCLTQTKTASQKPGRFRPAHIHIF